MASCTDSWSELEDWDAKDGYSLEVGLILKCESPELLEYLRGGKRKLWFTMKLPFPSTYDPNDETLDFVDPPSERDTLFGLLPMDIAQPLTKRYASELVHDRLLPLLDALPLLSNSTAALPGEMKDPALVVTEPYQLETEEFEGIIG
jgi:hypothetical protein